MLDTPQQDEAISDRLPPGLRLLRGLVIVLLISMIVGVLTLVWVIVTRLPDALAAVSAPAAAPSAPLPSSVSLPPSIGLPEGEVAQAVTFGADFVAVVTGSGRILIYGAKDGALWQEIVVTRP